MEFRAIGKAYTGISKGDWLYALDDFDVTGSDKICPAFIKPYKKYSGHNSKQECESAIQYPAHDDTLMRGVRRGI